MEGILSYKLHTALFYGHYIQIENILFEKVGVDMRYKRDYRDYIPLLRYLRAEVKR